MRDRTTCLFLLAVAATALSHPARAAGPEQVLAEPVVEAPVAAAAVTDWTGAYGGLSFGAAFGRGTAELGGHEGALIELDLANGLFPDEIDESQTDPIFGVTLGYNYQRGAFVGGVEFDFSALNQDIEATYSRIDPNPDPIFNGLRTNTSYQTEISGLATLRLRGGYAAGPNLVFATAGLAGAQVKNDFVLDLPDLGYTSPDRSESDTRFGYVLGLGYERRFSDRMSVKGEVLWYDLQDVTIDAYDPDAFPGQRIGYDFSNDGYVARVGVNFAF